MQPIIKSAKLLKKVVPLKAEVHQSVELPSATGTTNSNQVRYDQNISSPASDILVTFDDRWCKRV